MNVNERLFSKSSDALRIQIAQLVADIPSFIAKKDRKDRVVDTALPVTSQQGLMLRLKPAEKERGLLV
jgi:hypothetical protein